MPLKFLSLVLVVCIRPSNNHLEILGDLRAAVGSPPLTGVGSKVLRDWLREERASDTSDGGRVRAGGSRVERGIALEKDVVGFAADGVGAVVCAHLSVVGGQGEVGHVG